MKIQSQILTGVVAFAVLVPMAHAIDALAVLDTKAPCEKPEYPRASLVNEESGTVTLGLLIAPSGDVTESKIEKSSGYKNLDKAALKALSECKFKPVSKDKPDWGKIDYVWKLD